MHELDQGVRDAAMGVLRSAVTVDGGPSAEQTRLLDAIADHVLHVPGGGATDLAPEAAAVVLADASVRHLVSEGLVTLELMCHPPSTAVADRVDGYLSAFGFGQGEQELVRDAVAVARERVAADWARMREVTGTEAVLADADADELVRFYAGLADCPPGSLGREFHEFYGRTGFSLPIGHESLISHDFVHVLTGYEPVPEGELALQALLVAATRGTKHMSGLMASLLLYEAGLLAFPDIEPKEGVLDRPGAADLFADAIARGLGASCDLQALDHVALCDRRVVELRAELGIPEPAPGPFTHVP